MIQMTPPPDAMHHWPHPSFIDVEAVNNLRDIGGYPVSYGVSVRRKLVYRSGYLDDLTEEGRLQIQKLGIKKIFDLRSFLEVRKSKRENCQYASWLASSDGPERIVVPVFCDEDFAPEALAVRFKDYADAGTEVRSYIRLEPLRLTAVGFREGLPLYSCQLWTRYQSHPCSSWQLRSYAHPDQLHGGQRSHWCPHHDITATGGLLSRGSGGRVPLERTGIRASLEGGSRRPVVETSSL